MSTHPLLGWSASERQAARPEVGRPSRRVALVFGSFKGGGVAKVMLLTAGELLERGFAVDLVVGRDDGELRGSVPERGAVVKLTRAASWRTQAQILAADSGMLGALLGDKLLARKASGKLRYLPSLAGYFRRARPDAVLVATAPFNLIAVWARRVAGLDGRVVVSEHNQLAPETVGEHRWRYDCSPAVLRRGYLQADAIVAVSEGVAVELTEHAGIPRDRITTVYNPVAGAQLLDKARAPLDHPWFAPDQPPVILTAGKLKPQKDFPTLLRAFSTVRRERHVRLVILGDARGPGKDTAYLEELRGQPARLGVADDVSFAGFTENPFAYMSRAAVFVLSSAWEGFANVLVEALACGCPVASTDCRSGPAEILDNGRYGPLVPVGDDAALAGAISRLLDAPPQADKLRARAALFSVDRAVDQYLDLLLAPPSSPVL